LETLLHGKGVFARKLNVANAYHSKHMDFVADEYLQLLGDIEYADKLSPKLSVPMISTVTGKRVDRKTVEFASYWVPEPYISRAIQHRLVGLGL
jgi:acyl transferase domain-containing protein